MESRVAIFGHPLHPMLVVFPLGLFATAALFDLAYFRRRETVWRHGAFWLLVVGELGAAAAILAGLADYLTIPMAAQPRRIATTHLFLGLVLLLVFGWQIWLRRKDAGPSPDRPTRALLLLGLLLLADMALTAQGWLGGELAFGYRVAVKPDPALASSQRSAASGPDAGGRIFQQVCAGCHGAKGQGGIGPRLAGNSGLGGVENIQSIITHGRPPMMPSFAQQLQPGEIQSVAKFVNTLAEKR